MTEVLLIIAAIVAGVILLANLFLTKRKKIPVEAGQLPDSYKQILNDNVAFYQKLDENGRKEFENRVQHFLSCVRITGVGAQVEDMDRVLIGASAIIPIYAFPNWEYVNLKEVLLYPETFNEEFSQQGKDRSVLGMVGEGAMQRVMIISQHALRQGFYNKTDKHNTAIHEFVHLIDKTDGEVDGVPETLMRHQYVVPWLDMMHKNIREIMKNRSDINPYGATNQAEFFAVASEYFFERPDLLRQKHPELFELLSSIFRKNVVG